MIFESILSKCIPIITKNSPWKKFKKFNCGLFLDIKDKFAQKKIEFLLKVCKKIKKYIIQTRPNCKKLFIKNKVKLITKNYLQEYNVWINWRNRF